MPTYKNDKESGHLTKNQRVIFDNNLILTNGTSNSTTVDPTFGSFQNINYQPTTSNVYTLTTATTLK